MRSVNLSKVITLWVILVCSVQAASFDCAKAQTKVEKLICSDAELSKLDEYLATAYTKALKVDGKSAEVRNAQRQWVKERNSCIDVACVKHTYAARISSLTEVPAGNYSFTASQGGIAVPDMVICQDFIENLKRLGNPPMVCDRKFHPSITQFTWPQWKPIDAIKHRDLVEQIWQNEIGWAHDENLRTSFEARARSGEITLAVTQIPIDGKPTTILRFINGDKGSPCKPEDWDSTYPLRQYFAVDSKLKKLDFGVTYKSVLNGYFDYSKEMRPDLFLHKGKPYTAFWDMKGMGSGTIEIYGDHRNFCHINFTNNTTATGEKP
jgi:uncharacterized protein